MAMDDAESAAAVATAGDIDFANYRRPELFQKIQALLSVRDSVAAVVGWAVLELLLVWVSVLVVFGERVHWGVLAVLCFYGSLAGAVAGATFGGAREVNKALDDLLAVLDLSFELAEQAGGDLADIREGTKALPSARELYLGVFEQAVMPTVKAVVLSQARWLGRPIFWLYRVTLGRLVERSLVSSGRESDRTETRIAETLARAETVAQTSSSWIAVRRQRVAGTAEVLRRGVIVPLYAITLVCELMAVAPLLIAWYVTG